VNPEWIVGLVAVFLIFGGGHVVSEWLKGEQEIRRLKVQRAQGNANDDTLKAIEDLRKEVAELRDTTTRFDMSFDAAISHLEQRMDHLDQRTSTATSVEATVPAETVKLGLS
jgi:hypothetical protein